MKTLKDAGLLATIGFMQPKTSLGKILRNQKNGRIPLMIAGCMQRRRTSSLSIMKGPRCLARYTNCSLQNRMWKLFSDRRLHHVKHSWIQMRHTMNRWALQLCHELLPGRVPPHHQRRSSRLIEQDLSFSALVLLSRVLHNFWSLAIFGRFVIFVQIVLEHDKILCLKSEEKTY